MTDSKFGKQFYLFFSKENSFIKIKNQLLERYEQILFNHNEFMFSS